MNNNKEAIIIRCDQIKANVNSCQTFNNNPRDSGTVDLYNYSNLKRFVLHLITKTNYQYAWIMLWFIMPKNDELNSRLLLCAYPLYTRHPLEARFV